MAILAIKGHATRGKEVIETLEMLGGINKFNLDGAETNRYYYIDDINNRIYHCLSVNPQNVIVYTLEEFEEKFPYKVEDKVWLHYKNLTIRITETITSMRWCSKDDCVLYDVCTCCNLKESAFTPYKEETIEEKEISDAIVDRFICLEGYDFYDDKDNIINTKEIIMKRKKPKYPKTFKECFNICFDNKHHIVQVVGLEGLGDNKELFESFIKLKICRDAYWQITGDWKPDYIDNNVKYIIRVNRNHISFNSTIERNYILIFPTAEIRTIFYKNFKELIEQCKELL